MNQAVISISALSVLAALCSQLLASNSYMNAVRLVLGLEILRMLMILIQDYFQVLI